jgi:hypothetical protein
LHRDSKGRTPLDILQNPQDTSGLQGQLLMLPEDLVTSIKQQLQPKASLFLGMTARKASSTHSNDSTAAFSTADATSGARVESSGEGKGGGMSAAARLQAATSAEEVAEVLNSMSKSDQVHRVKLWARLPAAQLADVKGLSTVVKEQLAQAGPVLLMHAVHSDSFLHCLPFCKLKHAAVTRGIVPDASTNLNPGSSSVSKV